MADDPQDGMVRALTDLVRLTQAKELDCDAFVDQLAAYLDDGIDDADAVRLMEHHRKICPECDEQLTLLCAALNR